MADFAATRTSGRLGFADRVAGHVVMVHIALEFFVIDTVKHLLFGNKAERCGGDDLRLTARKHGRTVGSSEKTDFSGKRTDLVKAAAVNTFAVVEQPASYNKFLEFIHAFRDFRLAVFVGI